MDFRNWDPENRWGLGDYDRIGHLYSSGIKGIRKIHGDAEGKDYYWIWLRDLRLRSPISKDLYGSNTGLRLSMIISFRILDLVIIKTKLRDSEEVTWLEVLTSEDLVLRKFWTWVVVININGAWFSLYGGQLIGNSGDMKSGEGILIFMDQDLLVVRSSQQVMASGFYAGSVVWIVLEMLWYLGYEFKIGVLWLVEDSVMVCEIWLWWKSVYVFVNSNEKWICLGFEFHSGETFPKWRQKWRRVANWLTQLHLEFSYGFYGLQNKYQQTQESGNVYFWWAIILILDREFELAFELNLLAQWFNLLAQWFYLLRGFL
ncbi:unnamed protein product [Brassica napus]|uniref:(rape) hypothetical protein n=1 Tax=Brassica napus TaxID=3708 RepID=A0A816J5C1_BRANA|nr:unnamed protein product [Brassica napus]